MRITTIWRAIKILVAISLFIEAVATWFGAWHPAPSHVAFWALMCGAMLMWPND